MDRYIQDMLTISRLEHLPVQGFQQLDLNLLVEQVFDLLRPRTEGKNLLCQFDKQPDLPLVQGDQEQCRRMLLNLIENAVNYTPSGGQIKVRTYSRAAQVALEVIDSGIGIEAEAIPHIFDRFYRSSSAMAFEHGGTGLGLAIVHKIVEMHKASIEVQSRPGEGTSFCVTFQTDAP
jgi:two-component system phosphate regulon sensor histidine kinase PhoR